MPCSASRRTPAALMRDLRRHTARTLFRPPWRLQAHAAVGDRRRSHPFGSESSRALWTVPDIHSTEAAWNAYQDRLEMNGPPSTPTACSSYRLKTRGCEPVQAQGGRDTGEIPLAHALQPAELFGGGSTLDGRLAVQHEGLASQQAPPRPSVLRSSTRGPCTAPRLGPRATPTRRRTRQSSGRRRPQQFSESPPHFRRHGRRSRRRSARG